MAKTHLNHLVISIPMAANLVITLYLILKSLWNSILCLIKPVNHYFLTRILFLIFNVTSMIHFWWLGRSLARKSVKWKFPRKVDQLKRSDEVLWRVGRSMMWVSNELIFIVFVKQNKKFDDFIKTLMYEMTLVKNLNLHTKN